MGNTETLVAEFKEQLNAELTAAGMPTITEYDDTNLTDRTHAETFAELTDPDQIAAHVYRTNLAQASWNTAHLICEFIAKPLSALSIQAKLDTNLYYIESPHPSNPRNTGWVIKVNDEFTKKLAVLFAGFLSKAKELKSLKDNKLIPPLVKSYLFTSIPNQLEHRIASYLRKTNPVKKAMPVAERIEKFNSYLNNLRNSLDEDNLLIDTALLKSYELNEYLEYTDETDIAVSITDLFSNHSNEQTDDKRRADIQYLIDLINAKITEQRAIDLADQNFEADSRTAEQTRDQNRLTLHPEVAKARIKSNAKISLALIVLLSVIAGSLAFTPFIAAPAVFLTMVALLATIVSLISLYLTARALTEVDRNHQQQFDEFDTIYNDAIRDLANTKEQAIHAAKTTYQGKAGELYGNYLRANDPNPGTKPSRLYNFLSNCRARLFNSTPADSRQETKLVANSDHENNIYENNIDDLDNYNNAPTCIIS